MWVLSPSPRSTLNCQVPTDKPFVERLKMYPPPEKRNVLPVSAFPEASASISVPMI